MIYPDGVHRGAQVDERIIMFFSVTDTRLDALDPYQVDQQWHGIAAATELGLAPLLVKRAVEMYESGSKDVPFLFMPTLPDDKALVKCMAELHAAKYSIATRVHVTIHGALGAIHFTSV